VTESRGEHGSHSTADLQMALCCDPLCVQPPNHISSRWFLIEDVMMGVV
jgi:hypothetical protein